ncbi:MAG: Stp1/IreP family PP2C-type Ser/Thr phosphatase, partial [Myxococcales bacterium]|nr:Stp1/IreP family PP2C-type Ser/Thr phosphatase [Myxococcales bacterium]
MLPPTLPAAARSRLSLTSFGVTDVGRKREHNEDAFKIAEEYELFVLADGMGGHASGEVASNLTVNHVTDFFTRVCRAPDFVWPYPTPGLRTFEERAVSNSIQFANDRVFVESMKDRRYDGMGTTICVLAGAGEHLVLGHVGDSRIYRFRAGKLEQLTEDHSLINLYRRTRNVSEEELQAFGKKNVIVRAVGLKDYVEPDLQVVDRVPGDIFLMCSDGLSEMVDDWIIREVIMGDRDNLEEIGKTLVRLANQNGGKDNITVVLVRVL